MVLGNYSYLIIIIFLLMVIWFQVFQLNINNLYTFVWFKKLIVIIFSKQLSLQVIILNTNNLPTVIWSQVFPSNTNNS